MGLPKALGGQVGSIGLVNRVTGKVQPLALKAPNGGARRSLQIERIGYPTQGGEEKSALRSSRPGRAHQVAG